MDKDTIRRLAKGETARQILESQSKEESVQLAEDVSTKLQSIRESAKSGDLDGVRVLLGIDDDDQEAEADTSEDESETVQLSDDERLELEAARETAKKQKDCLSNVEAHCESLQLKLSKAGDTLSETLKSDLESRLDNITQFINKVKGE